MNTQKVIECSEALIKKHRTITFVESASAGKISYEFSTVPNSGKILIGGMVCCNTFMKEELLRIPKNLIKKLTPESAEVTKALANSFCKLAESDICVAITGLTSPKGSETPEKSVGTIFVPIILSNKQLASRFIFEEVPKKSSIRLFKKSLASTSKKLIKPKYL